MHPNCYHSTTPTSSHALKPDITTPAPPVNVLLSCTQLYWNMINNAWQSLNGLLNSFTRAAGAAERVLALVDLEPDIPPAGGISADAIPDWSIAVNDVHFRYGLLFSFRSKTRLVHSGQRRPL